MINSVTAWCSLCFGCQISPTQHLSTAVHHSWYEVPVLLHCIWILPNMPRYIITKHICFCLICSKDTAPEIIWFIHVQHCKPTLCCRVLFGEEGLSAGYSFNNTMLLNLFLIIKSWTLTFNMRVSQSLSQLSASVFSGPWNWQGNVVWSKIWWPRKNFPYWETPTRLVKFTKGTPLVKIIYQGGPLC